MSPLIYDFVRNYPKEPFKPTRLRFMECRVTKGVHYGVYSYSFGMLHLYIYRSLHSISFHQLLLGYFDFDFNTRILVGPTSKLNHEMIEAQTKFFNEIDSTANENS